VALARQGATVVTFRGPPADVAGLADVDARRARLLDAIRGVPFGPPDAEGISQAQVGQGRFLNGDDLAVLLTRAGVVRERMVDQDVRFARRRDAAGRTYFISNTGSRAVDGWVPLAIDTPQAIVFDPIRGVSGGGKVRPPNGRASAGTDVFLQIPPGGSLIVRTSAVAPRNELAFYHPAGPSTGIEGRWTIRFTKGGPVLPSPQILERLRSWTELPDPDLGRFSGTALYTATFPRPGTRGAAWALDLGEVRETARVRLNGQALGTSIGSPHRFIVPDGMLRSSNALEVAVTNLSANRIADLDRRGVPWKKFYNVNFPARSPENRGADGLFSAANWTPLDSGLIGPVTLTPLTPAK
jgi:hypothetical protein